MHKCLFIVSCNRFLLFVIDIELRLHRYNAKGYILCSKITTGNCYGISKWKKKQTAQMYLIIKHINP